MSHSPEQKSRRVLSTSRVIFIVIAAAAPMAAMVGVLPLALIRTHVPYVDLQPISAAPIASGTQREFRLIFEAVPANWDVKPPMIQVVHADLR